jgi:hypothetical protein
MIVVRRSDMHFLARQKNIMELIRDFFSFFARPRPLLLGGGK